MFTKFRNHTLKVLIVNVTANDTLTFSSFNLVYVPAFNMLYGLMITN